MRYCDIIMNVDETDLAIKKMANLLKKGLTMTAEICPACNSPLFLDKNKELFCGACDKKVVKATDDQDVENISIEGNLQMVKKILNQKIEKISILINKESEIETLNNLTTLLNNLLNNISKINNLIKN